MFFFDLVTTFYMNSINFEVASTKLTWISTVNYLLRNEKFTNALLMSHGIYSDINITVTVQLLNQYYLELFLLLLI